MDAAALETRPCLGKPSDLPGVRVVPSLLGGRRVEREVEFIPVGVARVVEHPKTESGHDRLARDGEDGRRPISVVPVAVPREGRDVEGIPRLPVVPDAVDLGVAGPSHDEHHLVPGVTCDRRPDSGIDLVLLRIHRERRRVAVFADIHAGPEAPRGLMHDDVVTLDHGAQRSVRVVLQEPLAPLQLHVVVVRVRLRLRRELRHDGLFQLGGGPQSGPSGDSDAGPKARDARPALGHRVPQRLSDPVGNASTCRVREIGRARGVSRPRGPDMSVRPIVAAGQRAAQREERHADAAEQ